MTNLRQQRRFSKKYLQFRHYMIPKTYHLNIFQSQLPSLASCKIETSNW